MRSSKTVHVISAHAEGEVGDVIVGGVAPPPGATLWEQSRFIAQDQTLRNFVLNEPRGGVSSSTCGAAKASQAQAAFIIMERKIRRRCRSNSICVATVLLDGGIIPMVDGDRIALEPGGLVGAGECRDGKASGSSCRTCRASRKSCQCRWRYGLGTLTVDIAGAAQFSDGGCAAMGFALKPDERMTSRCWARTTRPQPRLWHLSPDQLDWRHFRSACSRGADG